ncbi:MAG: hypothetical protein LBB51_00865, partial [Zoogloeaceae bacterium]|nr:hypothetical protein [Zoogloeaceae bacterium]
MKTENSMTNDCKTAVPEKAKSIYPAAIVATIFVFWFSLPSAGFMAFALVIPVAIWMLFQLVHAIRHSEARKYCALRVGVWFLAFALVFGINAFRDWNMRRQANAIITKIQD